jgi:hypothetical protein
MAAETSARSENGHSLIALHFPDGRELLWVTKDSPLYGWEVGRPVDFRGNSWVILGRTENEDSITFRLGVA